VHVLATLIVLQGPDKGRTLRTVDDVVLIGRGSSQIPLTDQTISRRHAELAMQDQGWVLTDLNSANGTYINGVRVGKPHRLKHGDQIRVGGTLLVYAGDESVQQYSGGNIPTDLVTLDAGSLNVDASVVASVPSSDESVVLAAPETAYAVKAWNVMRALTDVIGSLLPPDQMLARVLDVIFEEVEVDHGVIFVRDDATGEMMPEVVRLRSGVRGEEKPKSVFASRTIIGHVVESRAGVLSTNAIADSRFQSGKSVQNLGMRSVICAPIVAREQILGVIHLDCQVTRHTYNEHELRLVTAIGYQAGLAIENARLVQSQMQQERLAAAGETVAYLSHYIKNLLQGMRSGADILQKGFQREDFQLASQGWDIVERNMDRSSALMMNMLAFSKQREPRLAPVQVNRVIEDVIQLVQKQADAKQVVLLSELDDSVPPIPLDFDGIHQVVLNIVTNALDAVARGEGVVNVWSRVEPARGRITVGVTDNGPGVPPEMRESVFEPFQSSKGHGGTGLGLSVARKIVRELGGDIELHLPADGGAEFRVFLPIDRSQAATGKGDTHGPDNKRTR
jgi:two-component system NtrC family sensor kinase